MQYGASETDLDATTSLNVFISIQSDYRGISDFPWYQDVDTFLHGIRMRGFWVGGQDDCYNETCQSLTHEVGHALGLLHTHEGSPNPGSCTACAEPYTCDGTCQDEECDEFGDLCCDTAATSLHYCDDFEDLGGCLNGTWEDVDVSNYMSYSDDGCWDHFTPQQVSRMHCWVCNAHPGWIVDDDCNESGMPDVCDITRGDSEDCDENGVPDECQWMPERACCYDSTCDVMIGCECDELGGTFLGEYSSCSGAPCAMFGP